MKQKEIEMKQKDIEMKEKDVEITMELSKQKQYDIEILKLCIELETTRKRKVETMTKKKIKCLFIYKQYNHNMSSTFHETPTVPSKQFLIKYDKHEIILKNKPEFLQYTLELTNVGMMLENSSEFLKFAIWISNTSRFNDFNSYISDEFTRAFEYAKGRNYVYGRIYHYLNLLQKFIKHELNLNKSYHHHIEHRSLRSTSSRTFINQRYVFKLRYDGDMMYDKSIEKLIGNRYRIEDESKFDYNSLRGNLNIQLRLWLVETIFRC
jgi:hypothetical protein